MALQDSLRSFGQGLTAIGPRVYHYFRPDVRTEPFIWWMEAGEGDTLHADDNAEEQIIQIDVEYFSPTEYDPVFDLVQKYLNESGASWYLDDVLFEDENRYIRYAWRVEIASNGEIRD